MKLKFLVLFVFAICFGKISAQSNYSLQGTVRDSITTNPIEYGTVALYTLPDSVFTGYSVIDSGYFKIKEINPGNYFLKISCIGYEDTFQNVTIPGTLDLSIVLKEKLLEVKASEVVGYKNAFAYKNGNITATVENTVLGTIPDPIDMLAKLPTVQVSGDRESVMVIGKGSPIIYLDNQRITLNDLKSISVNDIRSIEIINNPSAKYEAEGQAVILITRKRNDQEGHRIDFTETAMAKRGFENRAAINASIKRRKTEIRANLQNYYSNRWEGMDGTLISGRHDYYSTYGGTSIGPRNEILAGIALYQQLKGSDYFSVNLNIRHQEEPFIMSNYAYLRLAGTETTVQTYTENFSRRPYLNSNFNYFKKVNKNTQLFFGGQYSHYERNLGTTIFNNFNNTQLELSETRNQNYTVNVGVARLDMETNLKNNLKWEYGGLVNFAEANTLFTGNGAGTTEDFISTFNYLENNQGIYSQLSGKLKKIDFVAGLRAENTVLQGGYKDSGSLLIDRKFLYFFPRVTFTVPVDSTKSLVFNYARSIRRPNYSNANQITNYINPFFEIANNASISPSITSEVSVTAQYKNYSLSAAYYRIQNPAYHVADYDSVLDKLRLINHNLFLDEGARLSLIVPFQYKNFTTSNAIMMNINRLTDPRAATLKTTPYLHAYTNNQFKLPKNYMFTMIGWVTTKRYDGIFERNRQFSVDLSLSKTFKKGLTVTLNAFDIFRSLDYKQSFTISGIYSSATYYENVREFSISIRYSLGKIQDAKFKNRDVNEGNRLN